ncbi:MAG: phytanoyl-CoA dioxygenase family protein, partial [Candidatus Binatia bacterium]|nr:phytanoyl-CoA dioxygenase family protein [Candidatus Binatia bacterium]
MSLLHLSVNDSSEAISEVLETSGAVILDDAGSSEALGELRRELTPYLEAARPGGDEFGGFSTRRVGALMAR